MGRLILVDEVEKFQQEWQDLTTSMGSWWGGSNTTTHPHRIEQGKRHRPKAIGDGKTRSKY